MNDLRRELAPISEDAWHFIEEEIRSSLKTALSVRKIVDFSGPRGWEHSSINLGRVRSIEKEFVKGVQAHLRMVQPLVELRTIFDLDRGELDSSSRGSRNMDVNPGIVAALQLAYAEDKAGYYGFQEAGIQGICSASPHKPFQLPPDPAAYPEVVAEAMEKLRETGVHGPYAMALDGAGYTALSRAAIGGHLVLSHVQRLLEGPVVWAPALNGAVVISMRGGDFELEVGRDIEIGYLDHDAARVRLYLEESIAFRALSPEAAVTLLHS
jgi:uncharacterized linocin/CFP29 family protein